MAIAQICFTNAMDGDAPVTAAVPILKERIDANATSQASAIAAPPLSAKRAGSIVVCTITATGGDIWAAFGVAPVASQGNDWLITAGTTRDFGIVAEGMKVAVINA